MAAHVLVASVLLVFTLRAALPVGSLTGAVCFGGLAAALLFLAWRQPRPLAINPASLSTRLGLAFAMVAAMPLLAAVTLVSQQQERAATTEALEVQRALGYRYEIPGSGAEHYQWICPPCRRASFALAQGLLWRGARGGASLPSYDRPIPRPAYVNGGAGEGPLGPEDAENFHP